MPHWSAWPVVVACLQSLVVNGLMSPELQPVHNSKLKKVSPPIAKSHKSASPILPASFMELVSEPRSHIELAFPQLSETVSAKANTVDVSPQIIGIPKLPSEQPLIFPRFKAGMDASNTALNTMTMVSGDSESKSEQESLVNALSQLNVDISGASQTVISEDHWIQDVEKVLSQYQKKTANVKSDITEQRNNIKKMLRTKRKVENLILQKQLQDKLNEATQDLTTLNSAIGKVKSKEESFTRSSGDVQATISSIKAQLSKLQGGVSSSSSNEGSKEASGEAAPAPAPAPAR